MSDLGRSRRAGGLWLVFTSVLLAGAIVLVLFTTTAVRWFVLVGAVSNVLVAWELMKRKRTSR